MWVYSKDGKHLEVEVFEQPWWRFLIAALYHWYDMRVHKIPGFRRLDWKLGKTLIDDDGEQFRLPLSALQDIRCFDLAHKGRQRVGSFKVDPDDPIVQRISRKVFP